MANTAMREKFHIKMKNISDEYCAQIDTLYEEMIFEIQEKANEKCNQIQLNYLSKLATKEPGLA